MWLSIRHEERHAGKNVVVQQNGALTTCRVNNSLKNRIPRRASPPGIGAPLCLNRKSSHRSQTRDWNCCAIVIADFPLTACDKREAIVQGALATICPPKLKERRRTDRLRLQ